MINLRDPYAITLKNPWAHLVAHRGKNVENRKWRPYDGVDQLLIHAGKRWDTTATHDFDHLTASAIVAVADLDGVCDFSRHRDAIVCRCGPWAVAGHNHWRLANVVALPTPVPAVGRQGLWRPIAETLDRVRAQLAAVLDEQRNRGA